MQDMSFDEWFEALIYCGEQEDCAINATDPEAYREYYDEGLSPLDTVMAETAAD